MMKTWLKHMIADYCIEVFFNGVQRNFANSKKIVRKPKHFMDLDPEEVKWDSVAEEWYWEEFDEWGATVDFWSYDPTDECWVSSVRFVDDNGRIYADYDYSTLDLHNNNFHSFQ